MEFVPNSLSRKVTYTFNDTLGVPSKDTVIRLLLLPRDLLPQALVTSDGAGRQHLDLIYTFPHTVASHLSDGLLRAGTAAGLSLSLFFFF